MRTPKLSDDRMKNHDLATSGKVAPNIGWQLDWPFDQPAPSAEDVKKLIIAYGNRQVFAQAIKTVRHFKTPARNPVSLLFSLSNDAKFKEQMGRKADKEARRLKLLPAVPSTPYAGTMGDWITGLIRLGFLPEEAEAGAYTRLWLTDEEHEALLQECEKG